MDIIMTEVEIISRLDHPNIVKIERVYENDQYIFIEMELLTGGTLEEHIENVGTLSDAQASSIMKQIFTAAQYLHDKAIVHRDMKPENVVFATKRRDVIKLIDFGLSSTIDAT